jgi:hypothetical protein
MNSEFIRQYDFYFGQVPAKTGKLFYVTGTFHGSIVVAMSEGDARQHFHGTYHGESIIHIKDHTGHIYQNSITPSTCLI